MGYEPMHCKETPLKWLSTHTFLCRGLFSWISMWLIPMLPSGLHLSISLFLRPFPSTLYKIASFLIPWRRKMATTVQYSCLKNSVDRGAWQALVRGVTKSQTWLRMYACSYLLSHPAFSSKSLLFLA